MDNDKMIKNLESIIINKYEPILIIKMMRMPSIKEIEGFRQYLKKEFGYNSLIFPGEMETDVKIISILNSEISKIDDIQIKMDNLIKKLESETNLPNTDQD
jgi:hypothetical protein